MEISHSANEDFIDPTRKYIPGSTICLKWQEISHRGANVDISTSKEWLTAWTPFADTSVSATCEGLVGCSILTVYSETGFQSLHLFESPSFYGDGLNLHAERSGWLRVPAGQTLYPGATKKFLKQKLSKVSTLINKEKFKWGKNVHVSLLMPATRDGAWRYDSQVIYDWETVKTRDGRVNKNAPNGRFKVEQTVAPPPDTAAEIVRSLEGATGLKVETMAYQVRQEATTWALQYELCDGGEKQLQIWLDDLPMLVGKQEFRW